MRPLSLTKPTSHQAFIVVFFLFIAILIAMPIYDFDIFWHLANGRAMLEQGRIIQEEIFSYTSPGIPFENNEWLSQIILYCIYKLSGGFGLIVFTALMTWLTLGLILRIPLLPTERRWVSAFFCFATVAAGITRFMPRPHLFSFLGIGVTLWLLSRWRRENCSTLHVLIALFLTILVWNALHGAIYGLIILLGQLLAVLVVKSGLCKNYLTDRPLPYKGIRNLALATLVAIVGSISMPVGFNLLSILRVLIFDQTMAQFTSEFIPPRFNLLFAGYWALLALTTIYLLRDLLNRKVDLAQIVIMLGFGLLSLRYMRAITPFLLVTIPYLSEKTAELLYSKPDTLRPRLCLLKGLRTSSLAVATLVTLAIKSGWLLGPTFRFGTAIDNSPDSLYPIGATNFINASSLTGNLYNSSRLGGYLAYFLSPQRPIFHYNHPKLFPDVYKLTHRPEALREMNINYAIVGDSIETQYLFKPTEWVAVYWEKNDVVLVRNLPENQAIIDRFQINFFTPEITENQIAELSKNPDIATKLAIEIGTYLRFRPDLRVANLFAHLILNKDLHIAPEARLKWAMMAYGPNNNCALLAQSVEYLKQISSARNFGHE